MAKNKNVIKGNVVNVYTGQGVTGLTVEAWDSQGKIKQPLGRAVTDAAGSFGLEIAQEFRQELGARKPDIFFKIFAGERLIESTKDTVLWNVFLAAYQLTIRITYQSSPVADLTCRVGGKVLEPDGSPLPGLTVVLYEKELNREKENGQTLTGPGGDYHLIYRPDPVGLSAGRDASTWDIQVKVFKDKERKKLLAVSPVILNARPHEQLNLVVGDEPFRGPAEFTIVGQRLAPFMEGNQWEQLDQKELAYLAGKTALRLQEVTFFVYAQRLSRQTRIEPEFFYALFKQDFPLSLAALAIIHPRELEQAIREALEKNFIKQMPAAAIRQAVTGINQQGVHAVIHAEKPPFAHIKELLDISGFSTREQETFIGAYIQNEGPLAHFWEQLQKKTALKKEKVETIRRNFQLSALTLNNPALIKKITAQPGIRQLKDLARYSLEDIRALLRDQGETIPLPGFLPGKTKKERTERYARLMYYMLEDAFPVLHLAYAWQKDTTLDKDVGLFLEKNEDYHPEQASITLYLKKHPDALAGVVDPAALTVKLKKVQNLFRITPRFDRFAALKTLWEHKLTSAYAIKSMGKDRFVRTFSAPLGGSSRALLTYAMAAEKTDASLLLLSRFSWDLAPGVPFVIPGITLDFDMDDDREATLAGLFGSLDYCQCEHCHSALSPAAYLVDLLVFLNQARAEDGETALEKLFKRRPDIGNIDLNCRNTLTPLPYIDLVNEVLENVVEPRIYTPVTHEGVTLFNAEVPQTGEEDPGILQANPEHTNPAAYETLKTKKYPWLLPFDLWTREARLYLEHLGMPRYKIMAVFRQEGATAPSPADIAGESLGLIPAQRVLITSPVTSTTGLKTLWGMGSGTLTTQLSKVTVFLAQANMDYAELKKLLHCRYINPEGADPILIRFDPEHPCALEHAVLTNLTNARLDRLHRFIRLCRQLSWELFAVDRALTALQKTEIDTAFLENLGDILALTENTQESELAVLLCFWSPLLPARDYPEHPSLYRTLFFNKALGELKTEVKHTFSLNTTRDELADTTHNLTDPDYEPVILGAINITSDELRLIIEQELAGATTLNLAHLSHLYRVAAFAGSIGLSIAEYLVLKRVSGREPLTTPAATATPGVTREFVERFSGIKVAGLPLADVAYLINHEQSLPATLRLDDARIVFALSQIRTELQKIRQENTALVPLLSNQYLVQYFHESLDLSTQITRVLLENLTSPLDGSTVAQTVFRKDAFVNGEDEVERLHYREQFLTYEKVYKASLLVRFLNIGDESIGFILTKGEAVGWLNPDTLPVEELTTPATAADYYERFLTMLLSFAPGTSGPAQADLIELLVMAEISGTTPAELAEFLAQKTGWSAVDVQTLIGNYGYTMDDLKQAAWLIQLSKAMRMVKRSGVNAAQLWSWNTPALSFEQARQIKHAVKAKYNNAAWLEIAPAIQDKLRESARDALLQYVIFFKDFADANDVYAYYLIDNLMSACMDTSRLKQAISSVQLFIQRILMGLEQKEISFTPADAREWQWRKNYRVWEANRKIFLYPENWLEPELRDNKSPFFKALEEELLQVELNETSVEKACLNYLKKLDRVAQLEVAGVYEDRELSVLHVIGRTKAEAHEYYYRQWQDAGHWTAWEKIELDIEGNHLLPVVHNRRLFLFWPRFTELIKQPSDSDLSINTGAETFTAKRAKKYYEIQLFWSQYQQGAWSPRQLSAPPLETTAFTHHLPEIEEFYFWADQDEDGTLYIRMSFIPVDILTTFIFKYNDATNAVENFDAGWGVTDHIYQNKMPSSDNTYMQLVKTEKLKELSFYTFAEEVDYSGFLNESTKKAALVLSNAETGYQVLFPHQYSTYISQAPVFYSDSRRTFFIHPQDVPLVFDFPLLTGFTLAEEAGPPLAAGLVTADGSITSGLSALETNNVLAVQSQDRTDLFPSAGSYYLGSSAAGMVIDRSRPAIEDEAEIRSTTPAMRARRAAGGGEGGTIRAGAILIDSERPELSLGAGFDVLEGPPLTSHGFYWGLQHWMKKMWLVKRYFFAPFYHPYTRLMIKQLNRYGLSGLLQPVPEHGAEAGPLIRQAGRLTYFEATYNPTEYVASPYPVEDFDFSFGGAYSLYNWEIFFHAPLLIATRLSQDQKFEAAQKWFHYIFDPTETDGTAPQRFWKIKPFYHYTDETSVTEMLKLFSAGSKELADQIRAWEAQPFNPHIIARMRIVAYMKAVVMKYIDNLLAWGDHLFRQDTMEAINEATQIYILAAQILGREPVLIERENPPAKTFNELFPQLDELSNALVEIEGELTYPSAPALPADGSSSASAVLNTLLYFCIPANEHLLGYWETVKDRLFKIRNCLNIEGVRRQLALFQPPIEPGLLVSAAAGGMDIASALSDLSAPLPHYRFTYMIQKAKEFCTQVKALGQQLLTALEKKDSEQLAVLRSNHEIRLLEDMTELKEKAITEARDSKAAFEKALEIATTKYNDYNQRAFLNLGEVFGIGLAGLSIISHGAAVAADVLAGIMFLIPDFDIGASGFGGSPHMTAETGGEKTGKSTERGANGLYHIAAILDKSASLSALIAGYYRRQEEWDLQKKIAAGEKEQVQKQIDAAEIRRQIAIKDLDNHHKKIAQAKEIADFYRTKFTNQELYNWQAAQVSTLYFQSYQMAYDLSKRAEKCFREELGMPATDYIRFGYWDSLKKGLLAGERLYKDLQRMEFAFIEQHKRDYELTKSISLQQLAPLALQQLKEKAVCTFTLPEVIFDVDFPGHYLRRIKSVSLTIPCVVGPYTSVSCTLTMLKNRVRRSTDTGPGYPYTGLDDGRFGHDPIGIQSIATSHAQRDSGLFEMNFRDERYLPFEGGGVISEWRLELPADFRQFDYRTITDIILHVHYTAREGGDAFKSAVTGELKNSLNKISDILAASATGLNRIISVRHELSNAYHQFLYADISATGHRLEVALTKKYFPFMFKDRTLSLRTLDVILLLKQPAVYAGGGMLPVTITWPDATENTADLTADVTLNNQPKAAFAHPLALADSEQKLTISIAASDLAGLAPALLKTVDGKTRLNAEAIEDLLLVVNYVIQ